jgi:lysophospholipid acyltransferase (LPLAT)-like uncharacterized protein
VVWLLARILLATIRLRVIYQERLEAARALGRPLLYAFWHGRQLMLFKGNPERGRRLAVITSLSRDGQMQSLICRRFGLEVVRGSSSRAGLSGLLALSRRLKNDCPVALAVDGPRGPVQIAKPGAVVLARNTGAPIVPVTVGFRRRWELGRAWDRFQIPWPFTEACMVFGQPIQVPADANTADVERVCERLTLELSDLTAEVDARSPCR